MISSNKITDEAVYQFSEEEIQELSDKVGSYCQFPTNRPKLNDQFFAELYKRHHHLVFEGDEKRFYLYSSLSGLWEAQDEKFLQQHSTDFFRRFLFSQGDVELLVLLDITFIEKVCKVLKGKVIHSGVFQHKQSDIYRIHTKNCVLEFDSVEKKWQSRAFSPTDYSRNRTEIIYDPKAAVPTRFLEELIKPAMAQEDIDMLQLYIGQCLLGVNLAQRILLISGTAGSGKSTLVNVVEQLVARANCTELRLAHADKRFEVARYIGKTLLTGKDVQANFLNNKGAYMLKALTGDDMLSAEFKHNSNVVDVRGNFNMIITSNATLHVKLENDAAAWERRLLWIKYNNPPPKNPVDNFDQLLICQEGSGILNWALAGALKLLLQGGKIRLEQLQKERIKTLLEDTDSIRLFVRDCITPCKGKDVTSTELWNNYGRYVLRNELTLISEQEFRRSIPDVMEQEWKALRRNDIMRNGRAQKGYTNVRCYVK